MAFVSTIKAYIDAEAMLYSAIMTHRYESFKDDNPTLNPFVSNGYASMIQLSGAGMQVVGSVHDFGMNVSRYANEAASGPETSGPIRFFGDQDVVIATREMIEAAYDRNLGDDELPNFFPGQTARTALVQRYIRGDSSVDVSMYDPSVIAIFLSSVARVLTMPQRTGWEQLAGSVQSRLVGLLQNGSYTVPPFVSGDATYRVKAEAVSGLVNNWQAYYPKKSPFNWNSYGVAVSVTIVSNVIIVPDEAKRGYNNVAKAGFYPLMSIPQNVYRTGDPATVIGTIQTNIARYVAAGNNSSAIIETAKAILRGAMV